MAGDRKGLASFYLQPLPFSGDRKMAGHRKGPASVYLQPLPFSRERKWPDTERGQLRSISSPFLSLEIEDGRRQKVARERKPLENRRGWRNAN
jgi:hypothetical protein